MKRALQEALRTTIESDVLLKRRRSESRINGMPPRPSTAGTLKPRTRKPVLFASILMFAILLMGAAIYIGAAPAEYQPIRIDGDFSDWDEVADSGGWKELVTQIRHYYLFSAPTQGRTDANRMDAFRLWIDTDADARTGLLVDGIGADIRLVLQFWRGDTESATLCTWQDGEAWEYSEFGGCRGIHAASSTGRVELSLMTWILGEFPAWLAESIPVLGARPTLRHGGSVQPEDTHGSLIWRDYVQAGGTNGEWGSLSSIGLAETYMSNTT